MQVTETLNEGLKHEFKVNVPASDLDAKADARLVDLKDKVRLNGFRPGKVPVSHLKKVYGRSVMAETIDQTIRDTNTQIFTERGFRLATEPKITMPTEQKEVEQILSGKSDLTYTVSIEVVPAIQLADFKSFKVEKPVAEVSEADVDEEPEAAHQVGVVGDLERAPAYSLAPVGEGQRRDLGVQAEAHALGSELEAEVLVSRKRGHAAEAATIEHHRAKRELVEDGGRREGEGQRRHMAREVGAAVVDADRAHAAKRIGGGPGQDVGDAGRAAHAEDGQEAGAAEIAVAAELPTGGVEEAAQIEVVAARAERRLHDREVQHVWSAVNDRGRSPELAGESAGIGRVGDVHLPPACAVSPAHALGGAAVAVQDPHRMAGA